MERGRPDQTVYTFEVPEGSPVTTSYPDDELWTRDYLEARAYAQEKGYQVIGNDYEFEDSELVDDFTPSVECGYCGLVIEQEDGTGLWADPDYPDDDDARRYCDEAPDHLHAPAAR